MHIGVRNVQAFSNIKINYKNDMQSVTNNSEGFADKSKCLNSDIFNLGGLFNEDPAEIKVAHYTYDDMTDNDKKDKIILRSIPDSCRAVVDFGAGEVNALIDTGAEITCIRPEYLPQGEGEIVPLAKVKLCGAYASHNTTEAT